MTSFSCLKSTFPLRRLIPVSRRRLKQMFPAIIQKDLNKRAAVGKSRPLSLIASA